ncbi:trypco2 family protein [Plantactinospora sonchi]|uniref:Trypco2 family protein n=1 Tax=Plantactinospora sonchi TaxID=1544735 RepID=A0ABU7S1Z7_9ACTN
MTIDDDAQGWGLAEAIEALKADLAAAAVTRTSYPKFPVTSATIELKVVATRTKTGKAGFKVPFVQTELGGELSHNNEVVSTVTVQLGAPVDAQGNQVSISDSADQLKR